MQIQHFCKWPAPGCLFVTLLTFHRDMAGGHLLFAIQMRSNLKSRWNKTYCFVLRTCWMIAFVKNVILLHIFMAIATDWIQNQNLTIPWVCLTVPSKTTGPFWTRCKKPSLHCRYTWTKLAGFDQPSSSDAILWLYVATAFSQWEQLTKKYNTAKANAKETTTTTTNKRIQQRKMLWLSELQQRQRKEQL